MTLPKAQQDVSLEGTRSTNYESDAPGDLDVCSISFRLQRDLANAASFGEAVERLKGL
jgi:hypothetical protein